LEFKTLARLLKRLHKSKSNRLFCKQESKILSNDALSSDIES